MKSKSEKGNILYIDDSKENLEGFYYTFFKSFKIYIAQNGNDALAVLSKEEIHVVIADHRMPDISGIELIELIKKQYPNIVFILITAYADLNVLLDAINKAGVFRFMIKPWEKSDMELTITNALKTYNLKESNKALINDLVTFNKALESANITLQSEIEERKKIESQLRDYQINLENIIKERTHELNEANTGLTILNEQLLLTNDNLNQENSERKKAQAQLENYKNHLEQLVKEKTTQIIESEEKYKTVFESSVEPILILTFQFEVLKANNAFFNLIECPVEKQHQIKLLDLCPAKYHSKLYQTVEQVIGFGYFHDLEIEITGLTGLKYFFNINAKQINYDNKKAILIIGQNITDKKNIQKKIYHAMLEAEETERLKLANDLHDEVGPLLSSLKLYIDALKNITLDDTTRNTFLNNSFELVTSTIASIREISNSLSPSVLSKFGLIASLNNLIDKTKPFIPVNFYETINDTRFHPHIEIVIYRIIKELINNTIKHAHATKIEIDIDVKSDFILLSYIDNGIGFNFQETVYSNKKGLGLNSILNRVKSIDGSAEFVTSQDKGMKFYLEIPLNINQDDEISNN
jgi:PAS domain S-box-containing protein